MPPLCSTLKCFSVREPENDRNQQACGRNGPQRCSSSQPSSPEESRKTSRQRHASASGRDECRKARRSVWVTITQTAAMIAENTWEHSMKGTVPTCRPVRLRLVEQKFGPVLRGECDRLSDKRAGRGIVQRWRSFGSVRDRHADLLEELLLPGGSAQAQQSRGPLGNVPEGVRGVSGHVDRVAGRGDRADAAERKLDLAVKDGEHLLEVVAVRRRPAARRNVHVDQCVAPSGVRAGHKDRVRVADHAEVRQRFIGVGAHMRQDSLGVTGRNPRGAPYLSTATTRRAPPF